MVKTVKQASSKAGKGGSTEAKISKFLASYRNTPHSMSGRRPAEILLGRARRTHLFLVNPCVVQRASTATEE